MRNPTVNFDLNEISKTRGARRIVKSKKQGGSTVKRCCECKLNIEIGDIYFNFGLRPTTANEKFYSRHGQIWYQYCEKCA